MLKYWKPLLSTLLILQHTYLTYVSLNRAKRQFGFRKNRGTKDAQAFVSSDIIINIDKKNPAIGTFLDLAKAFDTVNHEILLKKLSRYGIRGLLYDLLKSCLNDREKRVKISGCKSETIGDHRVRFLDHYFSQ